jgi:hypothetical protein
MGTDKMTHAIKLTAITYGSFKISCFSHCMDTLTLVNSLTAVSYNNTLVITLANSGLDRNKNKYASYISDKMEIGQIRFNTTCQS